MHKHEPGVTHEHVGGGTRHVHESGVTHKSPEGSTQHEELHTLDEIREHKEVHKQMTKSTGWNVVFVIAYAAIGIWFLIGVLRIYS